MAKKTTKKTTKKTKKTWPKWSWKKTEKVIQYLEDIFKIDWTVEEACTHAWIWTSIFYDWLKDDKEFSERISKAKDYMFIEAKKTLQKGIKGWDVKAAIEYLKRRDKRYSEKIQQENTNYEITDDDITEEQKQQIVKRYTEK